MLPKWDDIKTRFLRIESEGQRQLRIIEQEKRDDEEREALTRLARLYTWASDPVCAEIFLPIVEDWIKVLEYRRGEILSDHPTLCETLGRESELKALAAKFREWAAKA